MTENKITYKDILIEERDVLSNIIDRQNELRKAVKEKDWTKLMDIISAVNVAMDKFTALDEKRESLSRDINSGECFDLLCEVRGKLLKCRVENNALNQYVGTASRFVRGIVNEALPQSRPRLYSHRGRVVQAQPKSIVVNTLS
ncbi:MAG: hypothetical protein ACTTJ1_05420 [Treponema sp.]|jgi:hypothetical protein